MNSIGILTENRKISAKVLIKNRYDSKCTPILKDILHTLTIIVDVFLSKSLLKSSSLLTLSCFHLSCYSLESLLRCRVFMFHYSKSC